MSNKAYSDPKPFGEIIESSLTHFMGQCWQWNIMPQFGSLVAIEGKKRAIIGIVHQIQTGSMDPVRYPFPYQKTHEELLAEQPQIFEFLKTTFICTPLGYAEKGRIFYLTSPEPSLIHSFVGPLEAALSRQFFASDKYLHLLFHSNAQSSSLDDLLLAILKYQKELEMLKEEKLNSLIHTFSLLTGNDYRRLKLFLQRAEALF